VCETTAVVAVSVFGVNIGAFYQIIAMTAVLMLMMYLLLACRPFADAQSGRCILQGVQCLLLTSFLGLTFLRSCTLYPSQTYGLAMGALLLAINLVYLCSVVVLLLRAVDWQRVLGVLLAWAKCACKRLPCTACSKANNC
jgi:hypothetical protein